MAKTYAQKINFAQKIILRLIPVLLISPLSGGCSKLITPDPQVIEPAQRTAQLERVYRVQEIHQDELHVRTIVRWVEQNVYGAEAGTVEPFARQIVQQAKQHNLDPYLLAALITVESYYHPEVISYAGAVGLMQVIPYVGKDVAQRIGVRWTGWQTLQDPVRNIAIGSAYLKELIHIFSGDLRLALAAYNMGPTLLKQRLKQGFVPNGPYVNKVTKTYYDIRNVYQVRRHFQALTSSG